MAKKKKKENEQISLEEYNKIKEKRAKDRAKMQIPWIIKGPLIFPFVFFIFLILIYVFYARTVPTH